MLNGFPIPAHPPTMQQWLNLIAYNQLAGYCVQPQYFDILRSQLEQSQVGHVSGRSPAPAASFIELPRTIQIRLVLACVPHRRPIVTVGG